MKSLKECDYLNQYYYENWNSYLNVYLLKIVVLLCNHEHNLQTIFLPKNILYLLSHFLSQHFLNIHFQIHWKKVLCLIFAFLPFEMKFFCILYIRSIPLLWSLLINKRCITLEIAKDLNTVRYFLFWGYVPKKFILLKIFIIKSIINTKYFHGFVTKINTFFAIECHLNPFRTQIPAISHFL